MARNEKDGERTALLCRAQDLDGEARDLNRGADQLEFAHQFPTAAQDLRDAAELLQAGADKIREWLRKDR